MSELVAFREDRLGFRVTLLDKTVLGRSSDCDLILFDRSASRNHAEITKIDDSYFIVDLNSTNGTLVNDQPITLQTKLNSFDCVKIGQEIFIFDPYLDIITGQAPAALILNAVNESHQNLVSEPAIEAAAAISQEQAVAAAAFSSALCRSPLEEIDKTIVNFLVEKIGATSISILWPGPVGRPMVSYLSYPEDKRLLLSHVPFKRVTEIGQALIWPRIITELDFNSGNRHVGQLEQNCLLTPVYGSNPGRMGLLYIENSVTPLGEADLRLASLAAQIFSPFVVNAVAQAELEKEKIQVESEDQVTDLGTRDNQVKIVFSTAAHVAQDDTPIFLSGESGTDKTSLARHIHQQSFRKNGRLVIVTLSDMPPAQMDRLLFGQDDANDCHPGLLTLADGGTVFLRHVEHLTNNAQRSVLMALEEGLIYPVGSRVARNLSLRFITSSSQNLRARVDNGSFREDLFARLTRINLSLPPLRETKNDIEGLVNAFLTKAAKHLGASFLSLDNSTLECLRAYPWPGNISELRSECALLAHLTRNGYVHMDALPIHLRLATEVFTQGEVPLDSLLGEAERRILVKALASQEGDVELVAEVLNISPEDVILKSRAYGLDPMDFQLPTKPHAAAAHGPTALKADELRNPELSF
ncbi:MAG: sigma 54-interacting transcriptional regulator [Deltaproteobacteria bacterium]|jgi:DNA-binding NtrC family response regulator|nr:sigma 54-interacting transcriptional regulator [Deltaproteobacteria bacterium]